jgi:hypothetical protein
MNTQKTMLALGLSLFAFSAGALAAEEHEHGGEGTKGMGCGMMDMHDMHAMTPEARKAKMDEMFAKIDTDKNGSISRAEFDRQHEHMMMEGMEHKADMHDHEQHK